MKSDLELKQQALSMIRSLLKDTSASKFKPKEIEFIAAKHEPEEVGSDDEYMEPKEDLDDVLEQASHDKPMVIGDEDEEELQEEKPKGLRAFMGRR